MSGGDEGEDENKQADYVKKEFIARPFDPTPEILEAVENSSVKNKRPLIRMRVSRPRIAFGGEPVVADRDANDLNPQDIKPVCKPFTYSYPNN